MACDFRFESLRSALRKKLLSERKLVAETAELVSEIRVRYCSNSKKMSFNDPKLGGLRPFLTLSQESAHLIREKMVSFGTSWDRVLFQACDTGTSSLALSFAAERTENPSITSIRKQSLT